MPKVYISQEQKETERRRRAVRGLIRGKMGELKVKGKDAAKHIGLTPSAFSSSITNCSLSLIQFLKLNELLHFTDAELRVLFGVKA